MPANFAHRSTFRGSPGISHAVALTTSGPRFGPYPASSIPMKSPIARYLPRITRRVKAQDAECFGTDRGRGRLHPAFDADGGNDPRHSHGPRRAPLERDGGQFVEWNGGLDPPVRLVAADCDEPPRIPARIVPARFGRASPLIDDKVERGHVIAVGIERKHDAIEIGKVFVMSPLGARHRSIGAHSLGAREAGSEIKILVVIAKFRFGMWAFVVAISRCGEQRHFGANQ